MIHPTALADAGITEYYDATHTHAVTYLGFPLTTSRAQLLACATSVGAAPTTFFAQLKSIGGKFMMHRMFPRIKYETLCQPRSCGGVGVLDPLLQQAALRIRWLEPLFHLFSDSSYITAYLAHHLLTSTNMYTDPRFALVFPAFRPTARRDPGKTLSLFYRAMNTLNLNWAAARFSATTYLHLPLPHISSTNGTASGAGKTRKRFDCFDEFKLQFVPKSAEDSWWDEINNRRQGPGETIDEVAFHLLELFQLLGLKNDRMRIHCFLKAIKKDLAYKSGQCGVPQSWSKTIAMAKNIETVDERYSDHDVYEETVSRLSPPHSDTKSLNNTLNGLAEGIKAIKMHLVKTEEGKPLTNGAQPLYRQSLDQS
ncbi:uncharacterized protein BYT42DRAFT_641257 [Radiomyces spectabilis]|uniref:uncharacterized protein n=1 Tax=Radiomyces spectabilis TaxID=64574 RepID=UPI00221F6071|nr:uncharacterized protein BYT42DRAFT_641257 [Radiomyces spectabilis]KAI8394194.1 hypothetical protein BYT42DRAFT_641257 [Radiomyces spectabilis]